MDEKFTLTRTDKNNKIVVTKMRLETLIEKIRSGKQRETVMRLRERIHGLRLTSRPEHLVNKLQRVYTSVELTREAETGEQVFSGWNGVVVLTVDDLADSLRRQQARQLAATLPMTLATFVGSSGRTLKILVRVKSADGMVPADDESALRLTNAAVAFVGKMYDAVLPGAVRIVEAKEHANFLMSYDPDAYVNPKAQQLTISVGPAAPEMATAAAAMPKREVSVEQQRQIDMDKYDDYEFLYRQALQEVGELLGDDGEDDRHYDDRLITEVARRLRAMAFPKEEAVLHLRNHYWSRRDGDHIRAIVDSVYAEPKKGTVKDDPAMRVREGQQRMMRFLEERYVFRYNTIMGYTEYRPNNTWVQGYQPVSERVLNQMAIECRLEGLNIWDKDVNRYVRSTYVKNYNPVQEFLSECYHKWDGRDHIRQLAATVPTDNPHWADWFYTWFLGMVRQWQSSAMARYGNQTAPLLISTQGYNKSTFCQSLLPPQLQWGYSSNMLLSEKRQVLQQMSQMLLINLDEFNQISPSIQQGFLKNIITLPSVKVKRPYGRHVEQMPRMASFIATTNQTDVLSDPSGARRFLGVELTGPIDVSRHPNYTQLYAQALHALDHDEPSWFDEQQTLQIMESNRRFQEHTPAEQFFFEYFEPAANEQEGSYLSAATIFQHIRNKAGVRELKLNNLNNFGRVLAGISSIKRRRSSRGSEYLVKLREK